MNNEYIDKLKRQIPSGLKPSLRKLIEDMIDIAYKEGKIYQINLNIKEGNYADSKIKG